MTTVTVIIFWGCYRINMYTYKTIYIYKTLHSFGGKGGIVLTKIS